MVYTDHYTLWVKYVAHQKTESLRAAFFQSLTTRSTATLSSLQSTLNSLQNGRCSFIFRALFLQTTTPTFSPPKIRSSTSVNFHLPIHLCLFTNSSLQSPLTLPSSIPHQFLTFLVLHTNIPTIKTKNVFPTSAI